MYDWYHILDLVTTIDNNACLKDVNMDQAQFDRFFEKFKRMYAKLGKK